MRRLSHGQVIIRPADQIDQAKFLAWLTRRYQEAYEQGDTNHHGLAEVIQKITDNYRDFA